MAKKGRESGLTLLACCCRVAATPYPAYKTEAADPASAAPPGAEPLYAGVAAAPDPAYGPKLPPPPVRSLRHE